MITLNQAWTSFDWNLTWSVFKGYTQQLLYYSWGAQREPLKTCLRDEKRGHMWAPLHWSEKLERLDAHWTLEQNTMIMISVQFEMKSLLLTPDVSTDNERWHETKCRLIFQEKREGIDREDMANVVIEKSRWKKYCKVVITHFSASICCGYMNLVKGFSQSHCLASVLLDMG